MTQAEMALLQFVALTLPAVAILLQAILSYQERYFSNLDSLGFETEFRFLEWGFALLVFSGLLFSFKIAENNESLIVRGGVFSLALSLVILGVAVLVAFRRPLYLEANTTVESAIRQKAWKYSKPLLFALAISLTTYVVPTNWLEAEEFVVEISGSIRLLTGLISGLLVIAGSMTLLENYLRLKQGIERKSKWRNQALETAKSITEVLGSEDRDLNDKKDLRKFRNELKNVRQEWSSVVDSVPETTDEETISQMKDIHSLLNFLDGEIEDYTEVIKSHEDSIKDFEQTQIQIEELETELENQEEKVGRPGPDDMQLNMLESRIAELHNHMGVQSSKIKELEEEMDVYRSDLRDTMNEIVEEVDALRQEIERRN
ncbi:hypothetical protein [Halomontanus rarus]|uniref:hypothetical protein n=1 Tax=Halomontanus rarus TaxID=3034020 RepID=UPI001A98394C